MDYELFGNEDSRGIPAFPGKSWDEELPPITKDKLARARKGFWESRTGGCVEMWQALKLACEIEDAETARQVCASAGLSRWAREKASDIYCFDELGNRYTVPMFCVCEPRTLVERLSAEDVALHVPEEQGSGGDEEDAPLMSLSVRMSNQGNGKDVKLRAETSLTILELKEVLEEETSVPTARQRVLYQGRTLRDHMTLAMARVSEGAMLQVFVTGGT